MTIENKTIKSISSIHNIFKSVDIPDNKQLSKEEVIKNLDNNVEKFRNLAAEYENLLKDNFIKYNEYYNKQKVAKEEHSKQYFNKKINKYRSNTLQLVERISNTEKSIQNLTNLKEKLIKEIEKNDVKPESIEGSSS